MLILYIHGFASAGNSEKYELLKKYFPDKKVIAPTLPVSPKEAIKFLDDIISTANEPVYLVGTSLGGFYALYFAVRHDSSEIMINPSLTPWETLKKHIGTVTRYGTNETFEWKPEYLDELAEIGKEIENTKNISTYYLNFFLANDDEQLDHSEIPIRFKYANTIKWYETAGHRFTRFNEILPDIKNIINEVKNINIDAIEEL